VTKINNKP